MITSIRSSAAQLREHGIWTSITAPTTTVTFNARILGDIRHHVSKTSPLAPVLAENAVTITASCEVDRYNATLTLTSGQLTALENELLALRQEFVDLGFTSASVKFGFTQYSVDAAVAEVCGAQWELAEEMAA